MSTTSTSVDLMTLKIPLIELQTPLGDIDIHNFADFECLKYSTNGTLSLDWVASEQGKFLVGNQPIKRVKLIFTQVNRLMLTPRDPEIPQSEDSSLSHFIVEEASEGKYQIHLIFEGGIEIDVIAVAVNLLIEE